MISKARFPAFYSEPSVFTAEGLLREARRQKCLPNVNVPQICVLDPDGDIARALLASGHGTPCPGWPCYHTQMLRFDLDGVEVGLVPCAVGASYAVLVAEEMFAAGCELLVSITSAGQLSDSCGSPPYFILIDAAWRDEGTSAHYLAPADTVALAPGLRNAMQTAFAQSGLSVFTGTSWTTDAPFRETQSTIDYFKQQGAAAVEMEAAALYAFAQAKEKDVVCFAHVTNQMAVCDGDFEKGQENGAHDALDVLRIAVRAWLSKHA